MQNAFPVYDWTIKLLLLLFITGSQTSGTVVTLSGTGFDDTAPSANTVIIGGVTCPVTAATATELKCSVGEGPAGSHAVVVNVLSKGLAEHSGGPYTFAYSFQVTGISPTVGGTAGRTRGTPHP